MLWSATTFELVNTFSRMRHSCDALKLHELLADRQKVFLLLFEEE